MLTEAPPEVVDIRSRSTDGRVARCLGVLVAPRVALTAGHCVTDRRSARVRLAQEASARDVDVTEIWFDSRSERPRNKEIVDLQSADIAVLLLAQPIALRSYPEFARRPIPHQKGLAFGTALHRGKERIEPILVAMQRNGGAGTEYYVSRQFASPGDSGGPIFAAKTGRRAVVAITAGGGQGREVLTRVDLISDTIERVIAKSND